MTGNTTRGRRLGGVLIASISALVLWAGAVPAGAGQIGSEEFGLTFKQLVKKAEAVEDHIATCMEKAGFEYVANDFDSIRRAMNSDKTAPGLSEAEFRREFGFGISTQPDKPIVKLGLGEDNSNIREGLPEADRIAYDRTLLGEHTEEVFANALEAEDFSRTGGCTRTAVAKEFSKKQRSKSYINPGDQRIDQDQRVKEAYKKFAACMRRADVGEYQNPDEVEADIRERFDAIPPADDPTTLDEASQAELAELQSFELQAAEVSFRCETRFVEEVREEVEKEVYGRLPA